MPPNRKCRPGRPLSCLHPLCPILYTTVICSSKWILCRCEIKQIGAVTCITIGRSRKFEGESSEYDISAQSSFIADADSELYAFCTGKGGLLKKNSKANSGGRGRKFHWLKLLLFVCKRKYYFELQTQHSAFDDQKREADCAVLKFFNNLLIVGQLSAQGHDPWPLETGSHCSVEPESGTL